MLHSDSIAKLAAALVLVQREVEHAHKNATNPHFRNRYADLTEVIDTVRPVLAKHGLSVVQFPGYIDGVTTLESVLLHESGEWISGTAGARMQKDDPQGVGSALTYLRRYSLAAVCGISQDDDDGEAASRPPYRNAESGDPEPERPRTAQTKKSESAPPVCPKCGGKVWDNRAKKASGEFKATSPDFACRDKACKGAVWLKDEAETVSAETLQEKLNAAANVGAINVQQSATIEDVIKERDPDHMSAAMDWLTTQIEKKKLGAQP